MALNIGFLAAAIVVGAVTVLCVVLWVMSKKRVTSISNLSNPSPKSITIGPVLSGLDEEKKEDGIRRDIERTRGLRGIGEANIPIALKTVVGFFDTVYIGDTYSCKIYLFNTAKNAEQADALIKGILDKDEQKKFENDTLYAKNQDPVKIKINIFGPTFVIEPASRLVEIPAGSLVCSTHLIAPKNEDPPGAIIGKRQTLLISFDQMLDVNNPIHLGSIDYQVMVEKSLIPREQVSEIKTQEKISYISSAAGAALAVLTVITTILTFIVP